MRYAYVLVCAFLVGCSNNVMKYNVYSKSNTSDAQLNSDMLECRAMSKRLSGDNDDNYTMWQCMSSKGYAVTQRNRSLF